MKKWPLIASMIVIMVASVFAGAGTLAYFSDEAKSTGNTFTAGTLDLELYGSDWMDDVTGTWVSPSNWAPGETVYAKLHMRNTGTIGITHIGVKGDSLTGTKGLPDVVLITYFAYTEYWDYGVPGPGTTRVEYELTGWVISLIDGADGSTPDGKGSLREFIAWCDVPHSLKFFEGPWESGEPYLNPGGAKPQYLAIEFTFDPAAGNSYQGGTASFRLRILGAQSYEQWPPVWWAVPSHGY